MVESSKGPERAKTLPPSSHIKYLERLGSNWTHFSTYNSHDFLDLLCTPLPPHRSQYYNNDKTKKRK